MMYIYSILGSIIGPAFMSMMYVFIFICYATVYVVISFLEIWLQILVSLGSIFIVDPELRCDACFTKVGALNMTVWDELLTEWI
jgi:hypothetical protein